MKVEFKKGKDKDTLVCTRDDGTTTWMTTTAFFTVHDLAHFAIETKMNFKQGFYGLLAHGMNITDFENKQKFNPREMPAQAMHAEHLVNLLMTELSDGNLIDDFQKNFDDACARSGFASITFEPAKLEELRQELSRLLSEWHTLPVGHSLLLKF